MKNILNLPRLLLFFVVSASFTTALPAQDVPVPDAGLNAAIRQVLQKPTGPLTVQDLLSLTNLDASHRSISTTKDKNRTASNVSIHDSDTISTT